MKAETLMKMATGQVFDEQPALASLLSKLKVIRDSSIPTFATDGKCLRYNPEFVETGILFTEPGMMSIAETSWALLHELGHVFLGHHIRMCSMPDARKANKAFDLALNSLLSSMKCGAPSERMREFIVIPGQSEFSSMPHGESAEWYYAHLPDSKEDCKKSSSGEGAGKPRDGSGSGGGGQSGQSLGEVAPAHDGPPDSKDEEDFKDMVASCVNAAAQAGDVPGWLREFASMAYAASKVDWRTEMRSFLSKMVNRGTSWSRPSRRQWDDGIILPHNSSRTIGNGLVVVDTSESMSDARCGVALSELSSILQCFSGVKVTMRQCDTRVIKEGERSFSVSDFPLSVPVEWMGRGGTDLSCAFQQASLERMGFKWMVVVSDMYWSYERAPDPGMPVMWVVTNESLPYDDSVPFGKVVFIEKGSACCM